MEQEVEMKTKMFVIVRTYIVRWWRWEIRSDGCYKRHYEHLFVARSCTHAKLCARMITVGTNVHGMSVRLFSEVECPVERRM